MMTHPDRSPRDLRAFARAAACSLGLLACWPATSSATELGDLAMGLAPGEWVELPADLPGGDFGYCHHPENAANDVLQFANVGVWDPASRQFLFVGEGHGAGDSSAGKMLGYDEPTNTWWEDLNLPAGPASIGHAYDHNAIDASRSHLFIARYFARDVHRYDIAAGQWTPLPDLPPVGINKGMAYFDAIDTLIVVDPENESIYGWSPGDASWSVIRNDIEYTNFNHIAEYDHVREVVYFGGGAATPRALFELSADGSVRSLPDAIVNIDLPRGAYAPDPVNGHLIALHEPGEFAAYDPDLEQWYALPSPPNEIANADLIVTPISLYGVLLYFACFPAAQAEAWLYRHNEQPPGDLLAPAPPTNVRVQ